MKFIQTVVSLSGCNLNSKFTDCKTILIVPFYKRSLDAIPLVVNDTRESYIYINIYLNIISF